MNGTGTKEQTVPSPQESTRLKQDQVIQCSGCLKHISQTNQLFRFRTNESTQVFPNPVGEMRIIYTVRSAQNFKLNSSPTLDFTWFDGFTWEIITCVSCQRHLGWRYLSAIGDSNPHSFFGLAKEAICFGVSNPIKQ